MEAEAQCATLESLGLVDGTVTDDSDVFLFGGNNVSIMQVYRGLLTSKGEVEAFAAETIGKELGISREQLVDLAQLLGCDYCQGVEGIGPVLAAEIIAAFGSAIAFKSALTQDGYDATPAQAKLLKSRAKTLKKLDLPSNFPQPEVHSAFFHPTVDSRSAEFTWHRPQIPQLKQFLMRKLSWTSVKAEEFTFPLAEQRPIDVYFITDYYKQTSRQGPHRSKRLRAALHEV